MENNSTELKRKKKRHKQKSYIAKILNQKEKPNAFLLGIELLFAFILDILRIIKNTILSLFIVIIVCGVLGTLVAWIMIEPTYKEYKEFADNAVNNSTYDTFRLTESSYIYDSDGGLIVKLKADQDSSYIEYDDIPTQVVDAFVAVEDRTFWNNPGIDLKGLVRVMYNAVKTKGNEIHGASTITQQLSRNIFLTHEVSIERKAKEMLIAMNLTKKYTKREIMEFYVNDICYANAYYGIEAAAHGYFNKSVKDLTLGQITYLCAIPNSPSYYDPYKNPDRAVTRRNKILKDMLELDYITQKEYNDAVAEEIVIEKPKFEFNNYETTYAIDCAVEYLMRENNFEFRYKYDNMEDYTNYKKDYDEAYEVAKAQLYTGGYKVYTTIDTEVQAEMQSVLDDGLSFNSEINEESGIYTLQGAMTVIDNDNGKVIAIIGGRSQDDDSQTYSLNRAFQSNRQPGSSIKPLVVYTPALENGYTPESQVKNIDVDKAKKKGADIDKIGGSTMTLRNALEQSKNGVAWYLFTKLTPKVGLKYITDMEFASIVPDDYYSSASLGGLTYGATTVEMAGAYAAIENHGYFRRPTCIDKMIDKDGNDIYREAEGKQVYTEKAADTAIDLMKGVITKGTASKLKWYKSTKVEAAAKTGTTNSNKDGWMCGVTPYYTVTVWVGYDQPKEMKNLWGSTYPGQIWKSAMLKLVEDYDEGEFTEADYSDEDDLINEEHSEGYYSYMPGRDDSEELSTGYTVGDFRSDRVIGEKVDSAALGLYYVDTNSSDYETQLRAQYNLAQSYIDTIYSRSYKKEKQDMLDAAYKDILNKRGLSSSDINNTSTNTDTNADTNTDTSINAETSIVD